MSQPTEQLPEPEGWLAKCAIDCLRKWKVEWGPTPFYLKPEDIDHLEQWLEDLRKAWISTAKSLRRNGIIVEEYPIKIKR